LITKRDHRPSRKLGDIVEEKEFEGTLVLEKLALIDKIDAFFEAIDADDQKKAALLMRRAKVDAETIAIVLKKMAEADGEH
jgi:hypothetical protein